MKRAGAITGTVTRKLIAPVRRASNVGVVLRTAGATSTGCDAAAATRFATKCWSRHVGATIPGHGIVTGRDYNHGRVYG